MASDKTGDKDSVSFGYQADLSGLEEENRFLRESVENLERELEKFKRTPLISCEVRDLVNDKVILDSMMRIYTLGYSRTVYLEIALFL